jgi:hypothetical protein
MCPICVALGHPRLRGGILIDNTVTQEGSSPPTRGILFLTINQSRVIPAYAGDTPLPWVCQIIPPGYPRLRGGYVITICRPPLYGSSPPTRGIHIQVFISGFYFRVIPATRGILYQDSQPRFLIRVIPAYGGYLCVWI